MDSSAQTLKGSVLDKNGEVLPFVSVTVEQENIGTHTDHKGEFSLQLSPGNYTINFSFIGYNTHTETIDFTNDFTEKLYISLEPSSVNLDEAEVVSNTRDRAREIMKLVRQNRSAHLDSLDKFSFSLYQRISLISELNRPSAADSLNLYKIEAGDMEGDNPFIDKIKEVKEIDSKLYYKSPQGFKEFISGVKASKEGDFPDEDDEIGRQMTTGSALEFGENVVVPQFQSDGFPWILFEGAECFEINLYKTLLNLNQVSDKPVLSPLAAASSVAYKFDYKGMGIENNERHFLIQVTPINSNENLFSGLIWFRATDYSVFKFDLELTGSLKHCNDIRFTYLFDKEKYVSSEVYIEHSRKQGRRDEIVRVESVIDSVSLTPDFTGVKFNNEVKIIDPKAFDREDEFWNRTRAISLDSATFNFISKSDSLESYYESPEYLHKIDSAFNKIDIWTPIVGLGHRNRVKGNEWYLEGLFGQVVPFGIGGYRHRLPGYFEKEVDDDFSFRVAGHVDYGFANKDLKGKMSLGLTYNPAKFVRTKVEFGDYYEMINDFASLEQTFSRSNYVRTKMAGVSQRMEIVNGLYAELSFEYQDQLPIDNLEFSEWSQNAFMDLNTPVEFERYVKTEVRLQAQYRIKQEYYFKGNRKMVTPSNFPELTLIYRKGIKNLFGSEVDFDFLQLGAFQEIELGRFGSSRWNVELGTYLNKRDLRTLEYKYFRGSDVAFFSDPLRSFQLLGSTLNTPNEYFRVNAIHHFEGTILNKIPLIKKLKLGLAIGGGSLAIPDQDFYHAELFAGVEKSFSLFKSLVRFGLYAVNGEASVDSPQLTYKIGFAFYNTFTRKWDY